MMMCAVTHAGCTHWAVLFGTLSCETRTEEKICDRQQQWLSQRPWFIVFVIIGQVLQDKQTMKVLTWSQRKNLTFSCQHHSLTSANWDKCCKMMGTNKEASNWLHFVSLGKKTQNNTVIFEKIHWQIWACSWKWFIVTLKLLTKRIFDLKVGHFSKAHNCHIYFQTVFQSKNFASELIKQVWANIFWAAE